MLPNKVKFENFFSQNKLRSHVYPSIWGETLYKAWSKVVDCFKTGGVPYSKYPGFAEFESEITKSRFVLYRYTHRYTHADTHPHSPSPILDIPER